MNKPDDRDREDAIQDQTSGETNWNNQDRTSDGANPQEPNDEKTAQNEAKDIAKEAEQEWGWHHYGCGA